MSIRVLIADDEELITNSLKIILQLEDDIEVVGVCSNGDEAYRRIVEVGNVDIVLMDIRMPICDGVLATKKIMETFSQTKVIILTTFNDDEYIFEALKNGAKGYLLKSVKPDKIIEAIRVVQGGNLLVHSEVASRVSNMLKKDRAKKMSSYGFTEVELEIIKLISDGYTNKEISEKVFLSEGTIKNKITEILSKLNLRDRTQIAIFYLKN
ncbi:response regulator transcription factor [Desnuesiella massiliensis]|uniref:response regulator transcription factor n=1 Tax=Desnuesiella massiliensis TaxID=1650662 RepID=UPI0006E40742|nr:response regulator transcription factor [Desnuesiella massiliensis]